MKVLGVDPGIHGALAIVAINDGTAPQLIDVLDVPVIGAGAKERVNTMLVRDWLAQHAPDYALIERAGSMPKQGIASTFKYARAVGSLRLSTKPRSIGSPPETKMIGMDGVAAMAARVEVTPPPVATIAVTLRRTKSLASTGS